MNDLKSETEPANPYFKAFIREHITEFITWFFGLESSWPWWIINSVLWPMNQGTECNQHADKPMIFVSMNFWSWSESWKITDIDIFKMLCKTLIFIGVLQQFLEEMTGNLYMKLFLWSSKQLRTKIFSFFN